MDAKSIAEQARERARIALEQTRLERQEAEEQKRQEKSQRERPDYPDLLRAKVISGLTVKKTGDYTDDLAAFQKGVQDFVGTIPNELLLRADCDVMQSFFHHTVNMLSVVPEIPSYLMKGTPTEDELKPYIDTVLQKNLRARTCSALLADQEVRQRLFDTCEPVTLESRLETLAGEIQRVTPTPEDADAFQAKCRGNWMTLFDKIEEVNQLGYVQSGGVYIVQGHRDSGSTDAVYTIIQTKTHIGEKRVFLIERLKPIMETLISLAAKLESLPTDTLKAVEKRFRLNNRLGILGHLVNKLEKFGVWSTNQCIDHSHPYGLGEVTEPFLETIKQYAEKSPATAASILFMISNRIGPCMYYNCPEESRVDNSKEPMLWIELLNIPAVAAAFEGKQDPGWITEQLGRLLAISKEHAGWKESFYHEFRWKQDRTPQQIAEIWFTRRDDEAFWKKDKEQQSA